ncbi:PEP-CTERM sorting domain-containing protein [Leptothrix discophora]|uniref:PEPxxWA-CTERM sorting domain-containing protein n=1 Tax=Leptothrix discophora TaxID=89 RepID=A0ABT9G2T8_LEPDI|nr:PEP-CTERM sorting domain-containing protein [Leptothrix discophora]MDP4300800.1 PEPxxWA-CTERM sorting domain-containing protein [Leptothrix discophora]
MNKTFSATPRSSPNRLTRAARAWTFATIGALTGLFAGLAQAAVTIDIASPRFAADAPVSDLGNGLSFAQGWWASSPSTGFRTFQLSTTETASANYGFLTSTEAFRLTNITVSFIGGNDTVDGWIEFYNGNQLVASGSDKLDSRLRALENPSLSFKVGVTGPGVITRSVTLAPQLATDLYYDRVTFAYANAGHPTNYAGIASFTLQAKNPNSNLGLVAVSPPPVPEPSTYAMMLAGIGAIGFMTRRRRKQQD